MFAQLGIGKKIKRSSTEALKIIHRMLLNESYPYRKMVQNEFRALSSNDVFMSMNLGKHCSDFVQNPSDKDGTKDSKKKQTKKALKPAVFYDAATLAYASQALKDQAKHPEIEINYAFEIIWFLRHARPRMELDEFLGKQTYIDIYIDLYKKEEAEVKNADSVEDLPQLN